MYRKFPAGYFTGETTQWEIANVLLSEVRHSAGKAVPTHQHEAPYLSLLLEGAYWERGEDFEITYEPYTVVFHSAETVHEDEMLGPCRFFAVNLLAPWTTCHCRTWRFPGARLRDARRRSNMARVAVVSRVSLA